MNTALPPPRPWNPQRAKLATFGVRVCNPASTVANDVRNRCLGISVHCVDALRESHWVPAFAGMTAMVGVSVQGGSSRAAANPALDGCASGGMRCTSPAL